MKTRLHRVAIGLACASTLAGPAGAQQTGRYDGTDPNGHPISMTVADNPTSGNLEIVSATVSLPAFCIGHHLKGNTDEIWTWAPNIDIVGRKTTFHYYNGFAVINVQVAFPDATTATGGRGGASATFEPFKRGAAKCYSSWEKFTLSYSGPARAPLTEPNAALLRGDVAKP